MTERKKIEERLRKKEQEVASLEEKTRAARVYVQALRDILNMLSTDDGEVEPILRPGSSVAEARQAILKHGKPMHINDLLGALGKDATRDAKSSLTSSIAAYVRRQEIFTRTAPNTFGLIELGHVSTDEDSPAEPPSDFGKLVHTPDDDDIIF